MSEATIWRWLQVVDNGSSHRGEASAVRLRRACPNLHLVPLPKHASRLNQIENCFSFLLRKVPTPNDVASLEEVAERLLAFQRRYEEMATPFEWKFTRADLARLIARLSSTDREVPRAA